MSTRVDRETPAARTAPPEGAAPGPGTMNGHSGADPALESLPAIARVAAGAWLRLATWGLAQSLHAGTRALRAATDPDAAAGLVEGITDGLRAYAREFLGVSDLDDRVRRLAPPSSSPAAREVSTAELLRARGTELLEQAADVHFDGEAHPAYGRILMEIVPDEARILRLLATRGPQPTVDVRAGNLIGVGSQLVAARLNMIGPEGGLRHRDRVAAYLANLFRLGLVAVSEEPLDDVIGYQVLEAQPEVMALIRDTTRARTARHSVRLTELGIDFCRVCLPLAEPLVAGPQPALAGVPDPAQLPPPEE